MGVRRGDLVQDLVQRPGARSVARSFSMPRPWSGQELPGALLAGCGGFTLPRWVSIRQQQGERLGSGAVTHSGAEQNSLELDAKWPTRLLCNCFESN